MFVFHQCQILGGKTIFPPLSKYWGGGAPDPRLPLFLHSCIISGIALQTKCNLHFMVTQNGFSISFFQCVGKTELVKCNVFSFKEVLIPCCVVLGYLCNNRLTIEYL